MIKKINFPYSSNYSFYLADEIDSTNTYFKNNYNEYSDNSVLIALKQTNGRGRYNRRWESDNDLIFSILKKENDNYQIIIPLAITLALKNYDINTLIKWPNDIYLNNLKLSGILIEDVYLNKFISSIIGIGINYSDKPNVLGIGLNKDIDKYDLINQILNKIDYLTNLDFKLVMDLYKEYSFVIGKNIIYKGKEYYVLDIDTNGHLIIKNDKEILNINSDEINIKEAMI